jgi:hypothetical protein
MDENTKLLVDLTCRDQTALEREPVSHDVISLLEEARKRAYTPEGARLVEATRHSTPDRSRDR